ncbi:Non-histone chromosomal protein 6 [Podila clonocystis]|nr:Non-histone chromosomal protein 6 [Podila clonocystis]
MANPTSHFDTEQGILTSGANGGHNATPGSNYGYGLYSAMSNSMNFNHPSTYPIPSPATPPLLPPLQSNPYGSDSSNFQFNYQNDVSSSGSAGTSSNTALGTPTGVHNADPLDVSSQQMDSARRSLDDSEARRLQLPHPQQILDDALQKGYQHHHPQQQQARPHSPHQPPQPPQPNTAQHPQTPQQQQQLQQQQLQRQMHQSQLHSSPYSVLPHHHTPSHTQGLQSQPMTYRTDDKFGGGGGGQGSMTHLLHGQNVYSSDARHDIRLPQQQAQQQTPQTAQQQQQQQQQQHQQQQQQQQQRYMDPSMQHMMNRNGSRSGDLSQWPQQTMMPDMNAANGRPGMTNASGPIRHGAQGRVPKQRSRDFGAMDGSMGLNGMGAMGGMVGMPGVGMADRVGWGGMAGGAQYDHHHQLHHGMQPTAKQLQQMQQQRGGGPHARMGMGMGMGMVPGMGVHNGGGIGAISKKKMKRAMVPQVKDKNCPKRPRNSYIFFTLMKRDDIKKKHPEFKPTEITKMLGEEWQKLSETEKESYGNMAENDKKRYQSEMEAYDSSNSGMGGGPMGAMGMPGGMPPNGMVDGMGWRM